MLTNHQHVPYITLDLDTFALAQQLVSYIPAMQKINFNKQNSFFVKKPNLHFVPSASPLHSKMEMMSPSECMVT